MAKIRIDIKSIMENYLILLKQKGIGVNEAYLYGSYANGEPDEWSDIDVAIVSEQFDGNRFMDSEKIAGLFREVDIRLSILPLNQQSKSSFFIQKEVIEKGIRIC